MLNRHDVLNQPLDDLDDAGLRYEDSLPDEEPEPPYTEDEIYGPEGDDVFREDWTFNPPDLGGDAA